MDTATEEQLLQIHERNHSLQANGQPDHQAKKRPAMYVEDQRPGLTYREIAHVEDTTLAWRRSTGGRQHLKILTG